MILSDGDSIKFKNERSKPVHFVLLAGRPLNEPVYKHGPFVMNTQKEIEQTIWDYRNCRHGFERALYWQSDYIRFNH